MRVYRPRHSIIHKDILSHISVLKSSRVVFESQNTTAVQMTPVPCELNALLFCAPRENQSSSEYRDLDGSQSLAINQQRHQSKLMQLYKTLFYAARYQIELEDGEEGGTEKRRNFRQG